MLDCFCDLTRLKALYANQKPLRNAIYDGADVLKVWEKTARVDAGYLQSDAAFFLGQTAPYYGPAGNRSLAAYFAYFGHFQLLRFWTVIVT